MQQEKRRPAIARSATSPTSATSARPIISKSRSTWHASDALDRLLADFYTAHDRVYGYAPKVPVKIVNLRAVHSIEGLVGLDDAGWQPSGGSPVKRQAKILVANGDPVTATVYDRAAMAAGFEFAGPAIVEQSDTTTLVTPGWRGRVDAAGSLILER